MANYETRAPLPVGRAFVTGGSYVNDLEGRIYYAGGSEGDSSFDESKREAYRYTPSTDSWEEIQPLPAALDHHAMTSDSYGRIYCISGVRQAGDGTSSVPVNDMFRFDPSLGSWHVLPDIPTARPIYSAAIVADNVLYVAGGTTASPVFEAYDIYAGTWSSLPDMPGNHRYLHAMCTDDYGRVYVLAGRENVNTVDRINWRYDPSTGAWEILEPPPESTRLGGAAYHFNGTILLLGDEGNTSDLYYIGSDTWRTVAGAWGTAGPTGIDNDGYIHVVTHASSVPSDDHFAQKYFGCDIEDALVGAAPNDEINGTYTDFAADNDNIITIPLEGTFPDSLQSIQEYVWVYVHCRLAISGDDVFRLYARVVTSTGTVLAQSTGTDLYQSLGQVTSTGGQTLYTTFYDHKDLGEVTLADWNDAHLELEQRVTRNMGGDGNYIRVDKASLRMVLASDQVCEAPERTPPPASGGGNVNQLRIRQYQIGSG